MTGVFVTVPTAHNIGVGTLCMLNNYSVFVTKNCWFLVKSNYQANPRYPLLSGWSSEEIFL